MAVQPGPMRARWPCAEGGCPRSSAGRPAPAATTGPPAAAAGPAGPGGWTPVLPALVAAWSAAGAAAGAFGARRSGAGAAPGRRRRAALRVHDGAAQPARPPARPEPSQALRATKPSEVYPELLRLYRGEIPEVEISGQSTGWPMLDELYRVVPGELTVLTGMPGSGKTEFMLDLCCNMAQQFGWKFGLCCFEATGPQVIEQLLEKRSRCHRTRLRHNPEKLAEAESFVNEQFDLIGSSFESLSPTELLDRAVLKIRQRSLDAIVIDPYNYIDQDTQNETIFVSQLLSKLQLLAKREKCHVFLVAHPTKNNNWRKETPSLYDISGSAHFFNKCDMGIVVNRNRDAEAGSLRELEIQVQKVRNSEAGGRGSVKLYFNPRSRTYAETDEYQNGDLGWDGNEIYGGGLFPHSSTHQDAEHPAACAAAAPPPAASAE